MVESIQNNRCSVHPTERKEYFCIICKKIICYECTKADKFHQQSHNRISESLLENYEFHSILGKGSFGSVFKVTSSYDDQMYALKVFSEVNDDYFKLLKNESQHHFKLQHNNIIKYYSSFRLKEEQLFLILMELADDSLEKKITTISQEKALDYFHQICSALRYFHERRIIHRDVKPSNILFKNGEVKLSDIGDSKHLVMNLAKGSETINYLSPEVFNEAYNEKADVWAAGVVFHQMLSKGVHPFNPLEKDGEVKKNVMDNMLTIHDSIKDPLYIELLRGEFWFFFVYRGDFRYKPFYLKVALSLKSKKESG